jgi:hypothetical protein
MAEDQKDTQKEFKSCCEGMPFEDMMGKMMDAKESGSSFNCAEVMSQMMQMCCGAPKKKEEPTQGSREKPVPNP